MPKHKFLKSFFKALEYIVSIPFKVVEYLAEVIKKYKQKTIKKKIEKQRASIPAVFQDFEIIEKVSGKYGKWYNKLQNKSTIGIILGARGKGKTAIGVKILENMFAQTKKKCFALGFNADDMPSWIQVVEDIKDIKSNAYVLIDEGGVLFSSRKSMTSANQVLSDLILISRHKNLSIIFISQNSANLDINILRQADYLVLKPSSLLQKDFERKKIKNLYEEIDFSNHDQYKGITYIYSEEFRGFINNPLPSFWNISISKSFK